ncbi:MAG: acyl-homoserine-lactone synthase [Steroidobacteraceae bacterium]
MNGVMIARRNELTSSVLNSLHAFRREVFVNRLGWELPMQEGVERDQYDRDDTVYLTVRDDNEAVTACARLLPTADGAYMLPELFPELLGDRPAPRDTAVWEMSRFATSVRASREGRVLSLSQPTLDLLDCVFKFAVKHGIARLVLVTSIAIERLLLRAGLDVHRVAAPAPLHGRQCVALYIEC